MEISKTKASLLATLSSKKMRKKYGLFLAEGSKCVLDTLGAFNLENLVATPKWLESNKLFDLVSPSSILTASEEVLKKISSLSTPPEVIAVFHLPEESEQKLSLKLNPDSLYLMLDGIQDPGNLGTIIRTADWFGFNEVFCSKDTVDIFNPKAIQATMGSLKRVKVIYSDLVQLIESTEFSHIYGTMLEGDSLFSKKLSKSGVIVMGNEGKGLSEDIKKIITDALFIPPTRHEAHGESLNVAIATAITIAQFRK